MNEEWYDSFLRLADQRELTEQERKILEERFLADTPLRTQWEEDRLLNRALKRLPAMEVSSNFFDQVRRECERSGNGNKGVRKGLAMEKGWLRGWMPAWGGFLAAVALWISVDWIQQRQQRQLVAVSLLQVAEQFPLPAAEVLQDFETIHAMSRMSVEVNPRYQFDQDLLSALAE